MTDEECEYVRQNYERYEIKDIAKQRTKNIKRKIDCRLWIRLTEIHRLLERN